MKSMFGMAKADAALPSTEVQGADPKLLGAIKKMPVRPLVSE